MIRIFHGLRREAATALRGRFFPVAASYALVLATGFCTRLALLLRSDAREFGSLAQVLEAFAGGVLFDAVVATYFVLPLALWLALAPGRVVRSGIHRAAVILGTAAFAYVLLVVAIAEWLFWEEFGARFNFIAVDYLIYTREVLGNILESYPVGKMLLAAAAVAALVGAALARPIWHRLAHEASGGMRARSACALAVAAIAATGCISAGTRANSENDTARELGGNGIYQFFAALRANSLDFPVFYATRPGSTALVHGQLTAAGERWPARRNSEVERLVLDPAPEKRLNVVLVSVESLGAEFLGVHGNTRGLTPRLDRLAGESLMFTNVFATGNRTVRGLEALSLSIPPTPGDSIVKRPGSDKLFTLGSVFEDRGYEVLFLYGGYGYFDNMNAYFSSNDYRAVDRTSIPKERIHHENIWGVADEDLYDFTLDQLDQVAARGKPFFVHIMTTSNHRPYTYPAGRIDIASGSGRDGAVKYTDYALGRFIESAKKHAWFDDTLFVLTADHGANARGTVEIPIPQYRIPLFLYSPKHVAPGRVERLMSQIDIPPTVLGRLHFSYRTKFFGRDIFTTPAGEERAFVANYQTLGYMKDGRLVTLMPRKVVRVRDYPIGDAPKRLPEAALRDEAIAWYQTAADAFTRGQLRDDEANRVPASRAMAAVPVAAQP
jgi:phosphoglycerol transferase MdoB-like AlkP superfamily enzyme